MPARPVRKTKPVHKTATWLNAIHGLRAAIESRPARLAVLDHLPYWPEFIEQWQSLGYSLARAGQKIEVPLSIEDVDSRLAFCWQAIDDTVDLAVQVISTRLPTSTLETELLFQALQTNYAIFPDGSIHQRAQAKLDQWTAMENAKIRAKLSSDILSAARSADDYEKLTKRKMFQGSTP